MRYVRFLKTPRVVHEKNAARAHMHCLITITSDLGDSFLPYDSTLSAELLDGASDEVLVWSTVQWKCGMRNLPVTLPLSKSRGTDPVRVRVGVEPKSKYDAFETISQGGHRGVVSAWSAPVRPVGTGEAEKLVERRFMLGNRLLRMWEETGESIARHLWDAGITFSCHLSDVLHRARTDENALILPCEKRLQVLELGTGCGMVGIAIAQELEEVDVVLTDLPEANEIVERNIDSAQYHRGNTLRFQVLDWEANLPPDLGQTDLVIAADCTYNADSSPALVNTFDRVARSSPTVTVAIAMKIRHNSERVFFDLMSEAGFRITKTMSFELPGDEKIGEETVYLYIYHYTSKKV